MKCYIGDCKVIMEVGEWYLGIFGFWKYLIWFWDYGSFYDELWSFVFLSFISFLNLKLFKF